MNYPETAIVEYVLPIGGNLLIGLLLGWLVAHALKTAAKTLGCLLVVLFAALQVAAYFGVIDLNWARFVQQTVPLGEVASGALKSLSQILTHNVPLAAGAVVGFILGFRGR